MRKTAVRAVALAAVCFLSVFGTCSYAKEATSEPIQIVVLGDSIAKGYCGANKPELSCYGQTVAEEIAQGAGKSYLYQNYAKNGLATREFNEKVLKGQEVQDSLSGADVILITMGSNDLLHEFKKTAQEILNTDTKFKSADEALKEVTEHVKSNPLLVFRIIDALGNWDYQEFETQWIEAMDTISSCKKEEAQIVVTNIYNPVKQMELPGTMNQVVEDIIGNMNRILEKRSSEYGYQIADLANSQVTKHVQKDGLHPDQAGQDLIAEIVRAQITGYERNMPKSQVDGTAVKVEEIPEEKQSQIRPEKWGICLILAAVMLGGVGFLQKNRKENRHK